MNVITSNTHNVNGGNSFVAQGYNNSGGFAMNNASTYWGLMWNYAANDWRLGYGNTIAQQDWCMRWDSSGNGFSNSSHRAPIFYDSDNTAYYTNPATGTQINYLNVKGAWGGSPFGSSHAQLNIEGDNYPSITHRNMGTGGYWLVHHAADDTINWYGGTTGGYNGTAWNRNMYLDMSGNLTARGNITAYSDRNLKTNIVTIDNALNKVMSLRGVYFDWIESGEHSIGMIAQEVEEILPELIITNDEREVGTEITKIIIKSLDYSKIVSVLVEAIKEQQNKIEELNKRLTSVECK
jgi:hypothetical protein